MATLLLHDWEFVRDVIGRLNGGDISVAGSTPDAVRLARSGRYDVALVDVAQYGKAIRRLSRYLRVVGLSATPADPSSNLALLNGALTVVSLECKIRELEQVVKKAKEGSLEQQEGKEIVGLSQRQRDVLDGIVRGLNAPQIAEELELSAGYIRNVIRVLYEKAQVDKGGRFTARGKLVKWAVENGYGEVRS